MYSTGHELKLVWHNHSRKIIMQPGHSVGNSSFRLEVFWLPHHHSSVLHQLLLPELMRPVSIIINILWPRKYSQIIIRKYNANNHWPISVIYMIILASPQLQRVIVFLVSCQSPWVIIGSNERIKEAGDEASYHLGHWCHPAHYCDIDYRIFLWKFNLYIKKESKSSQRCSEVLKTF